MAIYHLHAKMVKRSEGRSAVGAAAYRAGARFTDERTGYTYDYTDKPGVEHTEIIAPEGAASWVYDRARLWNTVEESERRKDAQVAREIEIALPVELSKDNQVELMRDFVRRTFVSKGMVADFAIHRDNPENPHAHLMLTTRDLTEDGFGLKRRDWNAKTELLAWRGQWAGVANEHLARAGLDIRIDERTLEAQGIDLVPGRKIGLSLERQKEPELPRNLADRVAESKAIAAENGRRILEDPGIALHALTQSQATFTERDLARYLNTKTDGAEQFQAAFLKVKAADELVALGQDERGETRYTTREMLALERSLLERGERLAGSHGHQVSEAHREQVLADGRLSAEQREAFEHVTQGADLAVVVGVAGAGKSTMLESARRAWEAEGLTVKGAALSGIAAQNLEHSSGISSRTLKSLENAWEDGRDRLTHRDVLVIDEAGLVGTRELGLVLEHAEEAGAKVVLVGDPEQLQAIEAGAPYRGLASQAGMAELNEVRRQRKTWQKEATRQLATGHTGQALSAYTREERVKAAPTREAAREAMLTAWAKDGQEKTGESRLMLAYTRDDVRSLNEGARALRAANGELGPGEAIETERGKREFAAGDRLYFLKNERSLGVKNGSLGTVESLRDGIMQVRLDGAATGRGTAPGAGEREKRVTVDTRWYNHLDHGYAATVYKAQGSTVDRAYVLATPHYDRHSTYVALSRHREEATVFYSREDFQGLRRGTPEDSFKSVLSRERLKALAHDYLEREPASLTREPTRERVMEGSRAAEPLTARLERERLDVDRSIHELSAELAGIRALQAAASPSAGGKKLTAAERLRMNVNQRAAQLAAAREPDRPTLEDIGRQQLERESRRLEKEKRLEQEKRQALERQRDKGLELD
jgi:Ti-type conjugative transfer relaxase TraA